MPYKFVSATSNNHLIIPNTCHQINFLISFSVQMSELESGSDQQSQPTTVDAQVGISTANLALCSNLYCSLWDAMGDTFSYMDDSNSAGVNKINNIINEEGIACLTHWRDFSTRLKKQQNLKMRRMWRWPPPTSASSSSSGSSYSASFCASSSVLSGHFCCHLILIHCCQHIVDDW